MKAYQRLGQFLVQTGIIGDEVTCRKVASRLAQTQRIRSICEDDTQLRTVRFLLTEKPPLENRRWCFYITYDIPCTKYLSA